MPKGVNKARIPIGATTNGLHGKKYLVVLNGESSAIPSPPLVKASSMPCELLTPKKNSQINHHLFEDTGGFRNAKSITVELNKNAKNSE
ncbi:unnamed protein product [marine sediment metagenome]|uniref:Uncharacterized protein n=1 Tax=marine sediment metagenome TaxID=412755 RepID=X1GJ10_9ZZZZ